MRNRVPGLDNQLAAPVVDLVEGVRLRDGDPGLACGLGLSKPVVDRPDLLEGGPERDDVFLELVAILPEHVAVNLPVRNDCVDVRALGEREQGVLVGEEVLVGGGDDNCFITVPGREGRSVPVF